MSRRVEVPAAVRARLASWYGDELPARVRLVRGSLMGWLFGLAGQHAVTINRTVHWTHHARAVETALGTALLGHELYHVVQQQEMGWWGFLASYLWHWRPAHIRRGYEHPLERPAYERQAEVQRSLGA